MAISPDNEWYEEIASLQTTTWWRGQTQNLTGGNTVASYEYKVIPFLARADAGDSFEIIAVQLQKVIDEHGFS